MCGRDADGGNLQQGCGHKFNWREGITPDIDDYNEDDTEKLMEVNFTDIHYALPTDSAQTAIHRVSCRSCSNFVLGAIFECINCEDGPAASTLCVKCLQRDMVTATSKHKDHAFSITNPPRLGPTVALVHTTVDSNGLIKIHKARETCIATRKNRGRINAGPNSQQRHIPSGNLGAQRPKRPVRATMCRIDIYPDGRIVFADNAARAVEWISLDGIAFQTCGYCRKKPFETVAMESDVCNPETENRTCSLSENSLSGMHFHNGNLRLAVSIEELPPDKSITVGKLNNHLTRKKGVGTNVGVAVVFLDDSLLSLNQLSVNHSRTQELTPLTSPLVGDGVECNVMYWFDRDAAIAKLHGTLTFSEPLRHTFGDGSSDMLLFTLPDILRPVHTHDVLVFGQGSSHDASSFSEVDHEAELRTIANSRSSSSSGGGDSVDDSIGVGSAVLRIHPDGQVLLRCLTIDTPCALQKLFLSGIVYKTVQSTVTNTSSLEISSFAGQLSIGQFVFGDNVCSRPDPNTLHAVRPPSLAQEKSSEDSRALEEAVKGGYTSCRCGNYPCACIKAARERFRRQGIVSLSAGRGDPVDFGVAGVQSKDGYCFLTGQVLNRLQTHFMLSSFQSVACF